MDTKSLFCNSIAVASTVPADEIARAKGLGCLRDKTTPDCFNCRVVTRNGRLAASEMDAITEAARRFGSGDVAMTTRLSVEIQRVPYQNLGGLFAFLSEHGLSTGGTGPRVRPVVSCKGTTCVFGLIDTYALSREIHERFYLGYHSVKLPHKFKIAVGGCPNNCVKPDLNDVGIVGHRIPEVNGESCRACKVCGIAAKCPVQAVHTDGGKAVVDRDVCLSCGRCMGKCPFHAFDAATSGCYIYLGGRWGKRGARGIALSPLFRTPEEVLLTVEKAILFYKDRGLAGERFGDTIARIGFDEVERVILSDELILRKEEIICK